MQQIREINQDFIRELRREGRKDIADELLKVYYEDLKKTKKQELNNLMRHRSMIYKSKGLCQCKRKLHKNYSRCIFCLSSNRKSIVKCNSLCICGKSKFNNAKLCKKCYDAERGTKRSKECFYKKLDLFKNIKKNYTYNFNELSLLINLSRGKTYRFIKKLINYGIMKRVGKGKWIYV